MSRSHVAEINNLTPGQVGVQYRVVDLSGVIVTALTSTGVAETIAGVSGNFRATITIPDTAVAVQWFTSAGSVFEGEELVLPASGESEIQADIDAILARLEEQVPGTTPVVVVEAASDPNKVQVIVRRIDLGVQDTVALRLEVAAPTGSTVDDSVLIGRAVRATMARGVNELAMEAYPSSVFTAEEISGIYTFYIEDSAKFNIQVPDVGGLITDMKV